MTPARPSPAPRGEYQLYRPPPSRRLPPSPRSPTSSWSSDSTLTRVSLLTTVVSALALAVLTLSAPAAASQRGVPGGAVTPSSAPANSDARVSSLTPAPFVSKCRGGCGNGKCDEDAGKCECHPGWRGADCSLCGGKIK